MVLSLFWKTGNKMIVVVVFVVVVVLGQNAERSGSAGRIWMVTICGSIGPICGSVITVGLGLGYGLGLGLVLGLGSALGLGMIVVYKLLEKWQNADQSCDQNWPMAIRPVPHFVVSRNSILLHSREQPWDGITGNRRAGQRWNRVSDTDPETRPDPGRQWPLTRCFGGVQAYWPNLANKPVHLGNLIKGIGK